VLILLSKEVAQIAEITLQPGCNNFLLILSTIVINNCSKSIRLNLKRIHKLNFFTILAGIIIFAHTVIPHHHHFDSIEAHPENLECETSNPDKHNENPEAHCHAFNIIITNSGSDLTIQSSPSPKFNVDLFDIKTSTDLASELYVVNYTHCLKFVPNKQIFLTNHSLRAPPITV